MRKPGQPLRFQGPGNGGVRVSSPGRDTDDHSAHSAGYKKAVSSDFGNHPIWETYWDSRAPTEGTVESERGAGWGHRHCWVRVAKDRQLQSEEDLSAR